MPEIVPESVTLRFNYPKGSYSPTYTVHYIDGNNQYKFVEINSSTVPNTYTTLESVKVGANISIKTGGSRNEVWMINNYQASERGDIAVFSINQDALVNYHSPITIQLSYEYSSETSSYINNLILNNVDLDYTDFTIGESEPDFVTYYDLEISHDDTSTRDIEIEYTDREDTELNQIISAGDRTTLYVAAGSQVIVNVDPSASIYHLDVMGDVDEDMARRSFEFTMPDDDSSMTIKIANNQIQLTDLSGGLSSYTLYDFQ